MSFYVAFVDNSTNLVNNIIIADPRKDPAPEGFSLVALSEGSLVTAGWKYDRVNHRFIDQNNIQIQEALKL